jgi:hypothetical protein
MKNYFTLTIFFFILCCFGISAQPGKLISQAYYSFDTGTGAVVSADSFTVAYNNQLLPDLYRNFKWNVSGAWELKGRSTDFQYDGNGNRISYTLQTGNDSAGWTNTWRYSNTYNANNQELSYKLEKWGGANWVLNSLSEKVYDANGLLISSGGDSYRRLYTYNAEALLETETSQYFTGGNWVNLEQITYTYYPSSTLLETQTYWSWAAGAWNISYREVFQYDANGNNTQELTESLVQNQWTPDFRLTLEYDAQNNLVYWIRSDWDGVAWKDDTRQFNTFDQNNNFTSGRLELLNGTSWEMATFGRLHYGALSSMERLVLVDFDIFPNPAVSSITLKGANLQSAQLFDRQGRLVGNVTMGQTSGAMIPVAHLSPGTYFIQVMDEKGAPGVKPLVIVPE